MVEQLAVEKRSSFGKLKDELFGITVKAKSFFDKPIPWEPIILMGRRRD
jgi:hypothetical protein